MQSLSAEAGNLAGLPQENAIMNRLAALALALSLVGTSAVALADTGRAPVVARHEKGNKGEWEKKFPMPAAQFQQKAGERAQKAREHLEKRLTDKQVPADKANEIRAKFNAQQARVAQKVSEVCADGTVTLDEAKAVMAIAREGHKAHEGRAHQPKK